MRKVIMLTSLMLLVPAVSHAATLEDLLVEKGVITKGEAKSAMAATPGSVSYAKGVRWDFSDKKFSGQINTMIQTRYTFTSQPKDSTAKNTSGFDVTKARIILTGNVLDKEFFYKLEGDFVGDVDSDGNKSPELEDAYIGWRACDWAELKMGQFKTNFGRQFQASDAALQFPNRSITSDFFDLGRQGGAHATLKTADLPVKLGAGMFNGQSTGEGQNSTPKDTKMTGVVDVAWQVMGEMNVNEESDVSGTEDAALNIGGAYAYSDMNVGENLDTGANIDSFNANANFKWQGWAANAEYFYQKGSVDNVGKDAKPQGFYAQVGYMLLPGQFELAGRYSYINCNHGTGGVVSGGNICTGMNKVSGVDLSANYYFWANQLKAQLAWAYQQQQPEDDNIDDQNTNQIIFQLAGYF